MFEKMKKKIKIIIFRPLRNRYICRPLRSLNPILTPPIDGKKNKKYQYIDDTRTIYHVDLQIFLLKNNSVIKTFLTKSVGRYAHRPPLLTPPLRT